jgi:hypothetical protein
MDEVIAIFRRSVPKTLGWLAAGAILTAISAVVVRGIPNAAPPSTAEEIGGWVGLLFGGSGTLLMCRRLFLSGTLVEVSTAGIRFPRSSQPFVPWTAISDVSARRVRHQLFLDLQLRPDAGHNVARVQTRWVNMLDLDGSTDDLLRAIRTARSRAAAGGHAFTASE